MNEKSAGCTDEFFGDDEEHEGEVSPGGTMADRCRGI